MLFVEFIQQMNVYFNERSIIHNNFFSLNEINDILIRIYINEINNPQPTNINSTIELLLDLVEDCKTNSTPPDNNPFSKFTYIDNQPTKVYTPHNPVYQNLPTPSKEKIVRNNNSLKQIPKEKYKKKSIPLVLKRRLWDKYFGEKNGVAICPCCRLSQISTFSFHCGHIISERCGGELILSNLIPLCQSCNSSMGTKSYTEFCEDIGIH
jgi:5-methylcytosine-specific restriction endonuclease McrA